MIELFKRTENGLTSKIEFDVVKTEEGVYVDFLRSEYSDHNKWKSPNVLTDKFLERCFLQKPYVFADPTGEITKNTSKRTFQKKQKL